MIRLDCEAFRFRAGEMRLVEETGGAVFTARPANAAEVGDRAVAFHSDQSLNLFSTV